MERRRGKSNIVAALLGETLRQKDRAVGRFWKAKRDIGRTAPKGQAGERLANLSGRRQRTAARLVVRRPFFVGSTVFTDSPCPTLTP